jgi:hypothetical protein
LYKIRGKEMIHYVKEAKEEAFKTVERIAAKEIHCLNFLGPFKLAKGSFIIVNCKNNDSFLHTFHISLMVSKENK